MAGTLNVGRSIHGVGSTVSHHVQQRGPALYQRSSQATGVVTQMGQYGSQQSSSFMQPNLNIPPPPVTTSTHPQGMIDPYQSNPAAAAGQILPHHAQDPYQSIGAPQNIQPIQPPRLTMSSNRQQAEIRRQIIRSSTSSDLQINRPNRGRRGSASRQPNLLGKQSFIPTTRKLNFHSKQKIHKIHLKIGKLFTCRNKSVNF